MIEKCEYMKDPELSDCELRRAQFFKFGNKNFEKCDNCNVYKFVVKRDQMEKDTLSAPIGKGNSKGFRIITLEDARKALEEPPKQEEKPSAKFKKVCEHCGAVFYTNDKCRVYCSPECNHIQSNIKTKAKRLAKKKNISLEKATEITSERTFGSAICMNCGNEFKRQGPNQKFCSKDCRRSSIERIVLNNISTKKCKLCGKEFTSIYSQKIYCSSACYKASRRAYYRAARNNCGYLNLMVKRVNLRVEELQGIKENLRKLLDETNYKINDIDAKIAKEQEMIEHLNKLIDLESDV